VEERLERITNVTIAVLAIIVTLPLWPIAI
jgi:hypothetical protein